MYYNNSEKLDRYVWANIVVQNKQTASEGTEWSGSTLFAIPSFNIHYHTEEIFVGLPPSFC